MSFSLEYLTSTVSMFAGDGIVAQAVNAGSTDQTMQVVIFQGGAGTVVKDTGIMTVSSLAIGGVAVTASASDNYWLRILTSSPLLIPKASFERDVAGVWVPVVSYRPGDFALIQLTAKF